jgi:hypothetical protein
MPLPRLIHPIKITISQWDVNNTVFDDDMKEPIGRSARSESIILDGQPKWTEKDAVTYSYGGVDLKSTGYVLFRYVDMNSKSWIPKRQDRITQIGHLPTELYVVSSKPVGHYPDQNGASLIKVYFSDMNPGKA